MLSPHSPLCFFFFLTKFEVCRNHFPYFRPIFTLISVPRGGHKFVNPLITKQTLSLTNLFVEKCFYVNQRWSRGHKARGQGRKKNPRPRTAFPRTDTLEAKDRNARGQGHKRKCSPKKKVFTKIFQAISTKKRFPKNFSTAPQNFNNSKNTAVLEPRTGQFSRT